MRRWPPVPGLRRVLTPTLTYLRRNRVQAEIAEDYRQRALRRGRARAPVLGMAGAPRTPVRQAQAAGLKVFPRLHAFGAARVDIRPGHGRPPRLSHPERGRPRRRNSLFRLLWRQRIHRIRHLPPIRKPRFTEFEPWEKEYNKSIARISWIIEQVIANFKT
jgi:hypothetical protein